MSVIFALNGLGYLAVSLMSFYIFYSFLKKEETTAKVGNILGVNGIFYLLMSFLNFFWVFELLEPNNKDFVLVNMVLTVVTSILILYAVYKITGNKNLVYLLMLFITTVFAINFSIKAFFAVTLAVSYLLMALVFLDLVFFSNFYLKRAGFIGLFYVIVSVFLLVLTFLGNEAYRLFWFLPTISMFFVFLLIYWDVTNIGVIKIKREKNKQKKEFAVLAYTSVFGRFLIFTVSISAFILVSSVAVHELGHALTAQYYGCGQFKAVIYDVIAPHTEIICDFYYNDLILTLSGFGATLVIALMFVLTGSQFTKGLSYMLFGFGLLISYGDLVDLGISKNIIALLLLLSLVIIVFATVKLSVYYLKQENIFKIDKKGKEDKNV